MDGMQAIVYERYGPPEVLRFERVEKPAPGAAEVLVKVQAASINYGDTVLVRGQPIISRLMGYGVFKPKHKILGGDLAGQVEAVGSNVKRFRPGDEVYADIGDCGFGAFAEYVCVPEDALVLKPANLTFEQAAAVPQAAVVALQGLRDYGQIQAGQSVLVNGASGGIGTFAVQIAKSFGAEVTGVCGPRNIEMVRTLGADHVIDYTQDDFTELDQHYDLIFDIVANRPLSAYLGVLNPKGRYVACAFNPAALFMGPFISRDEGKKARALVHKPNVRDLLVMKELLESGKVVPVIDRCYPLPAIPDAIHYHEAGQHHGKVVITMAYRGSE